MSAAVASAIALALYAIAAIPLAFLATSRRAGRVAMAYAAVVIFVVIYNTGLFSGARLTRTNMLVPILASGNDEQCRRVRELMDKAGLRVDVSRSPAQIVGQGADEIPAAVRDVVFKCYQPQPAG